MQDPPKRHPKVVTVRQARSKGGVILQLEEENGTHPTKETGSLILDGENGYPPQKANGEQKIQINISHRGNLQKWKSSELLTRR